MMARERVCIICSAPATLQRSAIRLGFGPVPTTYLCERHGVAIRNAARAWDRDWERIEPIDPDAAAPLDPFADDADRQARQAALRLQEAAIIAQRAIDATLEYLQGDPWARDQVVRFLERARTKASNALAAYGLSVRDRTPLAEPRQPICR